MKNAVILMVPRSAQPRDDSVFYLLLFSLHGINTISNLNYLSLNWRAPPFGVADYVVLEWLTIPGAEENGYPDGFCAYSIYKEHIGF